MVITRCRGASYGDGADPDEELSRYLAKMMWYEWFTNLLVQDFNLGGLTEVSAWQGQV